MSIIVKGMKMPASCTRCTLDAFGYCTAARRYSESSTTHERASFCPLVELPEKHGDLIDRNKLLFDIEEFHLSDGKFQYWVEVQNAIVEAEGEEGENEKTD